MPISAAGVTINVKMVAKPSPNTIAVDRLIHHCVDGAPTTTSRDTKSRLMPKAIGSTPRIAVIAVQDHVHALEDEALGIVLEREDALAAQDLRPFLGDQVLHPGKELVRI